MFRFKQFSVDQSGCAMKINTDGVLLGAMAGAHNPGAILDIGTGTGVIALMLAQRYANAQIDAVEIDQEAAKTAGNNFENSPFTHRLKIYHSGFESYFEQFPERKYDLIISNPPFYIDLLKSPGAKRTLAKHTDIDFFERLIEDSTRHLTSEGRFWIIIPINILKPIKDLAKKSLLYPRNIINIQSYADSTAHRIILCLGFKKELPEITNFTIYKSKDIYSEEYRTLLQPYFLAF